MADSYNELFGLGSHVADPDLQGWWKLDETSGTVITDSSGNGNNGTLYGGRTAADLTASANAAWNTSSLSFNGTTDYVTVPIAVSSPMSFGCLQSTAGGNNATVAMCLTSDTSDTSYFALEGKRSTESDTNGMTIRTGNLKRTNGTSYTLDPQQLVCVDSSFSVKNFYVDGVFQATNSETGNLSANHVGIGSLYRSSGAAGFHDGEIEEAWLFSRSLSGTEVAQTEAGPEPLNISAPSVTGTHETGETLSSSTGSWDSQSNGTIAYTYRWQTATDAFGTGLADISGATSSDFTLTASQEGLYVRCLVRGSNDGGHDASEDTGSAFALASAGGGGGPSSTGFPFGIYYRGAACV